MSESTEPFELAELLAGLEAAGKGLVAEGTQWLNLSQIEEVPALFQPREKSEKHISDLVRVIQGLGEAEPLTVIKVGERTIVVDGHHRLEAYRLAKANSKVPVRFFPGTVEEAVLEAGKANSKFKLPMTTSERMDYGWRLVLLGKFSKAQIREAAAISDGQVAEMRRVKAQLGEEAYSLTSWWRARTQARGEQAELSDEERNRWKEERAEQFADRLAEVFSTRLAKDPEIAALALARYFGRRLPEVWQELRHHLSEDEQTEELEPTDF